MGRVEPDDPAAPAEAGDAELRGVALARPLGPGDGRVEVRHHLGVGHLGDDLGDDLLDVLDLRDVPLPGVQLGGDGQVAELGEPAADVLDVLVDAEDLLHDEDDRERPARRRASPGRPGSRRPSTGIFTSPASSPLVSVVIVWAGDRLHRQGEAGGQRRDDESSPREIDLGKQARQIVVHRWVSLVWEMFQGIPRCEEVSLPNGRRGEHLNARNPPRRRGAQSPRRSGRQPRCGTPRAPPP